jgi:hypothetical protein
MKKINLILQMGVIILLAISTLPAMAQTATYGSVWTSDSGGTKKIMYNNGETVYIHWELDGTGDIETYLGATLDQDLGVTASNTGSTTWNPGLGNGLYTIKVNGVSMSTVAIATVFVVPELPLGIMMATIGCFAALGTMKLKHKKD